MCVCVHSGRSASPLSHTYIYTYVHIEGGTCDGSLLIPKVNGSLWNDDKSNGIYRIRQCPAGYVLIRDDAQPVLDRCVSCPPDTYSVELAIFGAKLWNESVEYYNSYCHPCPRSVAMCSGA